MLPRPRARRVLQLFAGLVLYGVSDGMLLLGGLGVDPWDVLHKGLSRRIGIAVGTWAIVVGVVVLLLWIPLRQRPGLGTLANAMVIGVVINVVLAVAPTPRGVPLQLVVMLGGVGLNGLATGAYIGAGLGPGPRDGLMTGLASRGHSLPGAHQHRAERAGRRMAPRRHGRPGHGGLRARDRSPGADLRAHAGGRSRTETVAASAAIAHRGHPAGQLTPGRQPGRRGRPGSLGLGTRAGMRGSLCPPARPALADRSLLRDGLRFPLAEQPGEPPHLARRPLPLDPLEEVAVCASASHAWIPFTRLVGSTWHALLRCRDASSSPRLYRRHHATRSRPGYPTQRRHDKRTLISSRP